ncbi:MAG: hypothetical protein R3346_02115 [Candidatus Spechtbacterales bacterium]|nr:hypothetical protein [Candidatus Spechtbacterales bacterium]
MSKTTIFSILLIIAALVFFSSVSRAVTHDEFGLNNSYAIDNVFVD